MTKVGVSKLMAKVTPKAFKDAFLSVPVSAGTHTIQFSYLPEGLIPGIVLFVLCTGGFVAYVTLIPARRNRKRRQIKITRWLSHRVIFKFQSLLLPQAKHFDVFLS